MLLASLFLALTAIQIAKASTLFNDGFESGNFNAWTGTGGLGTYSSTVETNHPTEGTYNALFTVSTNEGRSYAYKTGLSISSALNFRSTVEFFNVYAMPRDGTQEIDFNELYDPTTGQYACILIRYDTGNLKWGLLYGTDGGTLNWVWETTPSNPTVETVYDVSLVIDKGNSLVKLYVDSILKVSSSWSVTASSFGVYAGSLGVFTSPFGDFQMAVDNVAVTDSTAPISQYTLTIAVQGSGNTAPSIGAHQYSSGSIASITAYPSSGWNFSNWLLNGTNVGSINQYNLTMNANYYLTAIFTETIGEHLFDDGFESGDFDEWSGTITTSGGSATVTSNEKHTGTYSGQFHIDSGSGTRRAYSYINLNNLSELYASAYIYIPSLSLTSGQSLWLIQFADSSNSPLASYGVRADGSGTWWATQSGDYPYVLGSSGPSTAGWYLLEVYFTHASSGPTLLLTVNGVEVGASLNQDTSGFNNVGIARFGVGYYPGSSTIAVNVDDVSIDTESTSPPVQYTLTIGVQGSGTTTPTAGIHQYNDSSVISVYANPSSGWTFNGWLLNGTNVGTTNPYNLTMNANYYLIATFTEIAPTMQLHTSGHQILGVYNNEDYLRGIGRPGDIDSIGIWGGKGESVFDIYSLKWVTNITEQIRRMDETFVCYRDVWHVNMIRMFIPANWWYIDTFDPSDYDSFASSTTVSYRDYVELVVQRAQANSIYVDFCPYSAVDYYTAANYSADQWEGEPGGWISGSPAESFVYSISANETEAWCIWWASVINRLGNYSNVIFEIWNEPGNNQALFFNDAISIYKTIRNLGNDNLIFMQWHSTLNPTVTELEWVPTFNSQLTNAIGSQPTNIVYTAHPYRYAPGFVPNWYTNYTDVKAQVTQAISYTRSGGIDVPVVFNEMGVCSAVCDSAEYTFWSSLLQSAKELGVGVCPYYWFYTGQPGWYGEGLLTSNIWDSQSSSPTPSQAGQIFIDSY